MTFRQKPICVDAVQVMIHRPVTWYDDVPAGRPGCEVWERRFKYRHEGHGPYRCF